VLRNVRRHDSAAGYPAARLIGHVEQGAPEVRVEAK
jgi:hypothetical protein